MLRCEGELQDDDTYVEATDKVRAALKRRERWPAAMYKLFTGHPQGNQTFEAWHRTILETARRIDLAGYGSEKAAVDAVLIQTSSRRLRQKALQVDPDWDQLVDMARSQEQAQRKAQEMPGTGEDAMSVLQERVKRLQDEGDRKPKTGRALGRKRPETHTLEEKKASCQDCGRHWCRDREKCWAKDKECYSCGVEGTSPGSSDARVRRKANQKD